MNLIDAKTKIKSLNHLIGQTIPTTNLVIDDIIPAPNDKTFHNFLSDYLYTQDIDETIKIHQSVDFEILLLSNSKKKHMFDVITGISNCWYSQYF